MMHDHPITVKQNSFDYATANFCAYMYSKLNRREITNLLMPKLGKSTSGSHGYMDTYMLIKWN